MHVYLNRAETSAIIRWAHSELEALRNSSFKGNLGVLTASLNFYEGLILKLEGHRDNATQTHNR
jgi:hypothetical protein